MFLDIQKAFDHVRRSRLLQEARKLDFSLTSCLLGGRGSWWCGTCGMLVLGSNLTSCLVLGCRTKWQSAWWCKGRLCLALESSSSSAASADAAPGLDALPPLSSGAAVSILAAPSPVSSSRIDREPVPAAEAEAGAVDGDGGKMKIATFCSLSPLPLALTPVWMVVETPSHHQP